MVEVENQINDLEHTELKNNQSEQQEKKKRIQKNKDSVNGLWDNFQRPNVHITGVPEEEKEHEGDWGGIVLCTMFLGSSSVNASIFHSAWMDTFWTYLVHSGSASGTF